MLNFSDSPHDHEPSGNVCKLQYLFTHVDANEALINKNWRVSEVISNDTLPTQSQSHKVLQGAFSLPNHKKNVGRFNEFANV